MFRRKSCGFTVDLPEDWHVATVYAGRVLIAWLNSGDQEKATLEVQLHKLDEPMDDFVNHTMAELSQRCAKFQLVSHELFSDKKGYQGIKVVSVGEEKGRHRRRTTYFLRHLDQVWSAKCCTDDSNFDSVFHHAILTIKPIPGWKFWRHWRLR